MNYITLKPTWEDVGHLNYDGGELSTPRKMSDVVNDNMIEQEPMFYACDLNFCSANSGPLTRSFLNFLDSIGIDGVSENVVVDSRSHMLMEDWYPCIPGWHVDECPRVVGIPDPTQKSNVTHFLCVLGDVCPTQFLNNEIELPSSTITGQNLYKDWTDKINKLVFSGKMGVSSVKSGRDGSS